MNFLYLHCLIYAEIVENELLEKINKYRASQNINPLKINEKLTKAAKMQLEMNEEQGKSTHYETDENLKLPKSIKSCNYTGKKVKENLAQYKNNNAHEILERWKQNPEKNFNLLNVEYKDAGVCHKIGKDEQIYCVMIFGGGEDEDEDENSEEEKNNDEDEDSSY